MLSKILISILGMGIGLLLIIKTKEIIDFTGANSWIENTFGRGQTYNFIKILGVIVIFIFFLYLIGDLEGIIHSLVKLVFP